MPSPFRCLVIGIGLGWAILPVLVIADDYARYVGGGNAIAPVLSASVVGCAAGFVIGAGRLGWRGVVGTAAGSLSGGLLPYLVIAPVVGIQPAVNAFDQYALVAVAAVAASAVGAALISRSALKVEIRPLWPLGIGLIVLAIWLAAWVFWAIALSPQLV
jgi:hypothetical protein